MKIKLRTISDFNKKPIDIKVYLLLMVAATFCGNTWLFLYVTYLMIALVLLQFCMAKVKGFSRAAFVNKKEILIPVLLLAFSSFVIWQSLYISYDKSLTRNYALRYYLYSILLLFVPCISIIQLQVKLMKLYSVIAGTSGLVMTVISGRVTGGLFGDNNALGMMMSIAAVLFVVDYYSEKGIINIIGYVFSLICVFISGKRMFALLSLLALLVMLFISNNKEKKSKFIKMVIIGLTLLVVAYFVIPQVRNVFERFSQLSSSSDEYSFTSGRSGMWNIAMQIFNGNMIHGIGFANFAVYTGEYYSSISNPWAGKYLTHNIYVGLLSETGIIGFLLIVSFFLVVLVKSIRLLVKAIRMKSDVCRMMCYSISLQLWAILYGFTGNSLYDPNEFLLYIFAVSMFISCKKRLGEIKYED